MCCGYAVVEGERGEGIPLVLTRLLSDSDEGVDAVVFCFEALPFSGVLLRVREESSVSSGMVANFLRTCLRAGRRIGLLSLISFQTMVRVIRRRTNLRK